MFVPNYFFAPSLLHRYSLCCSCRPRKSSGIINLRASFMGSVAQPGSCTASRKELRKMPWLLPVLV